MLDCMKSIPSLIRTAHRAAGDGSGWLTARPARLLLRIMRAQQKALSHFALAGIMSLLVVPAWSATPPNTVISNTATASYQIGPPATPITLNTSSTATLNTAACVTVGIQIDLMQYIPPSRIAQAPLAANETVPPGSYSTSGLAAGPFAALTDPTLLGNAAPTALPATLMLAPLHDATGKQVSSFSRNEPVFVRVVSYDANVNPLVADTIQVTITTSGGDNELVQLTETGPSTGEFIGAIPTTFAIGTAPVANDGNINISSHNETITATYDHPNCTSGTTIASSSSGLVDPYGVVFDSATGVPVNGASVTLVDNSTGLPATVYCDDGTTILKQPVTTGSPTICDATMIPGGFRFPQVAAGSYKLQVLPPAGNTFPSNVVASSLPANIGSPPVPPVIWGSTTPTLGGSYGGVFTLWGPALKIDVPVDSGASTMNIVKTTDLNVVGTGEYIPYTLKITNNTLLPLTGAQIADHMPPGFRYQNGSSKLDGLATADPVVSADGSSLTYTLNIPASTTVTLRYVLQVTAAAHVGTAENTAAATGGFTSNTARASVVVREDLYRNKTILLGRVIDGSCDDKVENDDRGLANARIVLENGTYILTDKEGRWHIDNLRPGTHVVQLDLDSLPRDYEVVACENNTRFAGRSYSQFVNLQPGTMWRADFHVRKKAPESVMITQTFSAEPDNDANIVSLDLTGNTDVTGYSATIMLPEFAKYIRGSAKLNGVYTSDPDAIDGALIFRSQAHTGHWREAYSFKLEDLPPRATLRSLVRFTVPGQPGQNLPTAEINLVNHAPAHTETSAQVAIEAADSKPAKTPDEDPAQMLDKLPYDVAWLASAQPGDEWLYPQENFHPNLPVTSVAVKHDPSHQFDLIVNGEAVNPLRFDGKKLNTNATVALSTWRGVELKPGDNRIELIVKDAEGKELSHSVRNIHFSTLPDHVEFVPELSHLIADGKSRPVIAVRLLDKDGVPIRRGINGDFTLNEPYRSYDRDEGIDREPLSGRIGGKPRYQVGSDGLAMIELEPTTQTGEAVLGFQFGNTRNQEIRAWLEPGQRDWILVGFGEGTLGHKILSGNLQQLQADEADKQLFDNDKLAFYAKGSIRGDYLLTIAYDTAKDTGNSALKQAIDPTQYYTLYADATQAKYDAASSSRLYVKLERKQFYAMFGDYDTGLTVTELSRYSRTLNGVKSEYKGDKVGYNAFATVTSQAYVKDEIQGNGTSGIYKLSRSNIVVNSDKIRIETRDRFQSQNIISTQNLTPYLDYDIDYNNGTVTFHEPVNARDSNFNPVYIVAEYESNDSVDQRATLGGRGSIKPAQGMEVGATVVHEGTVGASGNLTGLDTTYQVNDKTKLRAEVASTNRSIANAPVDGSAWLGEVSHHDQQWDGKAYVREESGSFGMGQQAASENATRKIGADGQFKLSDRTQLEGQVYQQTNTTSGTQNSVAEGRVDNRIGEDLMAYYGARSTHDQSSAGAATAQSNQVLGGATYQMMNKRLSLHTAAEISAGKADSSTNPNRLTLGADYKMTEQSKIFAEQEFAHGERISASTTRVGLRTQPWMGGEMSASVGSDSNNDAQRIYSNLGMVQRWQIDEHWQSNFSIDRSRTMHNSATPLNVNTPLPSGTMPVASAVSGDYTAGAVSLAYHEKHWSADGRIELRNSSIDRQRNLQLGMQKQLDMGRSLAAGYSLRESTGGAADTRNDDLRFSYAFRPNDSRWIWFDRADYILQATDTTASSLNGSKLVNNLNANYMPIRHTQIALQYGAKYVMQAIDGIDYKGYTDLIGAEIRHDLANNWDVGVHGSMMRTLSAGVRTYGLGASVGYKVVDNMWLSVGYNALGMHDSDFSAASYLAKGVYLTLRMKVDQDSFGLNKGHDITRPLNSE